MGNISVVLPPQPLLAGKTHYHAERKSESCCCYVSIGVAIGLMFLFLIIAISTAPKYWWAFFLTFLIGLVVLALLIFYNTRRMVNHFFDADAVNNTFRIVHDPSYLARFNPCSCYKFAQHEFAISDIASFEIRETFVHTFSASRRHMRMRSHHYFTFDIRLMNGDNQNAGTHLGRYDCDALKEVVDVYKSGGGRETFVPQMSPIYPSYPGSNAPVVAAGTYPVVAGYPPASGYPQGPGGAYASAPGTAYPPAPGTGYAPAPGTAYAPPPGTAYAPPPGTAYAPPPGVAYAPAPGISYPPVPETGSPSAPVSGGTDVSYPCELPSKSDPGSAVQ